MAREGGPCTIGARVEVAGRHGLVTVDNEDGTWNVEFDDGGEADVATDQIVVDLEQPPLVRLMQADAEMFDARRRVSALNNGIRVVTDPWAEPKPEGWTRFVCFSDTHGLHDDIPANHRPPADVLLHAGDFSNTGEFKEVKSFADWLEAYPCAHRVVIAGNHDVTFHEEYYQSTGARRFHARHPYNCRKVKACLAKSIYLEDAAAEVCGYSIYGSPWQPEFCDWAFNLPRGVQCREKWDLIPQSTDILITHGPPYRYGDLTYHNGRAGCEDLLVAIRDRFIPVSLSGHIHEGYGCMADDATLYINASTCTHDYAPANPPIVFDAPPPHELRAGVLRLARQLSSQPGHPTMPPCQGVAEDCMDAVDPESLVPVIQPAHQ